MNTLQKSSQVQQFYERVVGQIPANYRGDAFANLRHKAIQALETLEFPTTKSENWKYVRTASLTSKNWKKSLSAEPIPDLQVEISHPCAIVFINGRFNNELSRLIDMPGIEIIPAQEANWIEWEKLAGYQPNGINPFNTLARAIAENGIAIRASKNCKSINEIGIYYFSSGKEEISATSNCFLVEEGAELQLSILHFSGDQTWQMHQNFYSIANNAELSIDYLQSGNAQAYCMSNCTAVLADNARFTLNTATLNGKFNRNEVNILLNGKGTEANLNGFYIPAEGELVDNHTVIDHAKPHSQSNETYRGILSGNAVGVFNGKVFVRQDAQKTNAYQSNANVLLSDQATMNSKPELEIYADDVKCSHGSTTGQLDSDALFYLRTRGLSEETARKVLVEAFAESVISAFNDPYIIAQIETTLQRKLAI